MANLKISQLPTVAIAPLSGAIPIVVNGTTSQVQVSGINTDLRTTVATNSATTWNYQGSDLKALSGNWQSTYTSWNATSATSTVEFNDTRYAKLSTQFAAQPYTFVSATSSIQPVIGSNTASGCYSNVGGGKNNTASSCYSLIAGGIDNIASNAYTTIGGGGQNCATGDTSTIGGGANNTASGDYSTIAGGGGNTASGIYSFIAGGKCNNTNSLANTFILGSNITAPLADYTYVNNLSSQGKLIGEGSSITNAVVTGRTIYVDSGIGTDTRTGLSKYSAGSPFATISAAVAASTTGDFIYVKGGSYTIASTINLNGKADLYFELGANITVSLNVVAFSLTSDEPHGVFGYGNFTCSGTGGFWTQSGGTLNVQQVGIQCLAITNNSGVGTVFAVSTGVIIINIQAVVAPASTIVSETGTSGQVFYQVYQTVGLKLLDMTQANSMMQFTANCWTVFVTGTEGLSIVGGVTSFIFQNLVGSGNPATKLVVFKFANGDATLNTHVFRGGRLISNNSQPCITFDSTTATNKSVKLMQDVQLFTGAANCIVSADVRDVVVSSAHSNVVADANTTIRPTSGALLVSPYFNF